MELKQITYPASLLKLLHASWEVLLPDSQSGPCFCQAWFFFDLDLGLFDLSDRFSVGGGDDFLIFLSNGTN